MIKRKKKKKTLKANYHFAKRVKAPKMPSMMKSKFIKKALDMGRLPDQSY